MGTSGAETTSDTATDLDRVFQKLADEVMNDPDRDQAFKRSTELVEALRRLNKAAGELRALAAARIWEAEDLSLGELAGRISVSKARAAQFVKTAEAQKLRAAVAVVIKDTNVLLVCRRGDAEDISWQFPAGIVKPGVLPATVAVQETLAETGVHCAVRRDLGSRVHPVTKALLDYFLCDYLTGDAENRDPAENLNVTWVPIDQIERFIPRDQIFPPILEALKRQDDAPDS